MAKIAVHYLVDEDDLPDEWLDSTDPTGLSEEGFNKMFDRVQYSLNESTGPVLEIDDIDFTRESGEG